MGDESLTSDAAKELSKLGAAKGGEARARKLSPERRREIARSAIEARWARHGKAPIPRATHTGPLKIGEMTFEAAVLEDGTRVISETQFMKEMGMYRSGALSVRRDPRAQIPLSLAYKNLKPFVEKHLGGVHFRPMTYITTKGNVATSGLEAAVIPKVCEVWIDADKAGVLGKTQEVIAAKADILLRGLAHVGIIALVDEATGYQDDRARDALAKILEAFVAKELRKWVKTFPADFYREMFRLRSLPYTGSVKKPQYIGHLTNDLVYARLAPGVLDELRRVTPRDEKGNLKHRLFQRLTEDIGNPKLREHLASVVALMKAADSWDQFMMMMDRSLKKYKELPLFEGSEERVIEVN